MNAREGLIEAMAMEAGRARVLALGPHDCARAMLVVIEAHAGRCVVVPVRSAWEMTVAGRKVGGVGEIIEAAIAATPYAPEGGA